MAIFESFRAVRWIRTFNLVLQAMLFLTLCLGLNYLARNHAWGRYDLTKYRRFSLSAETLSWLQQLKQPVRMIVTVSDDNDSPEIRGLLNEYVHATEGNPAGKITVEYLDVYQNRGKAERLGIDQTDAIVLLCNDKPRVLPIRELYRTEKNVKVSFQGEQVLTAALLDVSSPNRKKIYFLAGHAELSPTDTDPRRGLSAIRDELRLRNFDVDAVNLSIARKVPDDAALLIAVNPQGAFNAFEQELLRQYLNTRAGRLILFLPPALQLPPSLASFGLEDLLLDWGVVLDNDVICDTGPTNLTDDGDLIIWAYTPQHPLTQNLIEGNTPLRVGLARSVWPLANAEGTGLKAVTIAATSTTAWGEVSFRDRNLKPEYNPGVDIRARRGMNPPDRLGLIVASERVAVRGDLPFTVPRGRLLVFGTGDIIGNGRISDLGSQKIFINAVNWTVDRDAQLNIAPRPIEQFQLSLSASDFVKLRYSLLLGVPGLAALLGILVYWNRRH
jgi:hypothetical protein